VPLIFNAMSLLDSLGELCKERLMRTDVVLSGLILLLVLSSSAEAQVTIDASKISCEQFVHSKVSNPKTFAAWLSGFYSGKRDKTILNPEAFEADLSRLEAFCYNEKNFSMPVMQAIEQETRLAR
jgi:acid stress chaperone HdeB